MVRSLFIACLSLVLLTGSVSAQARIEVHDGATIPPGSPGIPDDTGIVEFGAAPVATVLPRTFLVRNGGNQPLTLGEPIDISPGFTVMRTFGQTLLQPGEITSFVVALNAASAGRYANAIISFPTNDPARNPFNFTLQGSALPESALRIMDNTDGGFRAVGSWAIVQRASAGYQGGTRAKLAGNGTGIASWTFKGLTPGLYQVAATWTANANQAPDARYTVRDGVTPVGTFTVDQRVTPASFSDAGVGWQNLGSAVMVNGNTLVVQLADQATAGSMVIADAVRLDRVGYIGRVLDDGSPGFSAQAPSSRDMVRGFQSDATVKQPNTGVATWTFSGLPAGQYRVSATWRAAQNHASNATFRVLNGTTPLGTVQLNQRLAPKDVTDGGTRWTDIGAVGQVYTITGTNALVVEVNSAGADGLVLADAVRVERVNQPIQPTTPDVVRFLEQATWGPDSTLINQVTSQGIPAFISAQLAAPVTGYPTLPVVHGNRVTPMTTQPYPGCGLGLPPPDQNQTNPTCVREKYTPYLLSRRFFTNAFYGGDQLRQRMAWALHKILVADPGGENTRNLGHRYAVYLQIIDRYSRNNFAELLWEMTVNPVMGDYLDMVRSTRTRPNENYARELLQLFTVGLDELHPDGTPILNAAGERIPTYDQAKVEEFTRALTGWTRQPDFAAGVPNWVDYMLVNRAQHDGSAKSLLQRSPESRSIPLSPGWPGTQPTEQYAWDSLNAVINNVMHHPNTGVYISKQLIQMLVTSNPSPGYVARVGAVWTRERFSPNQLGEVARAIFLDPEARGDVKPWADYGKLREPVQHAINLLRAFGVTAFNGIGQSDGVLSTAGSEQMGLLEQNVFFPPSVFSYFLPDNIITGTNGVLGPEFMIYSTLTSVRRHNLIYQLLQPNNDGNSFAYGIVPSAEGSNRPVPDGTKPNLQVLVGVAGDPVLLVNVIDSVLMGGRMSAATKQEIVRAVSVIPVANTLRRAKTALYLFMNSPEYMVQR